MSGRQMRSPEMVRRYEKGGIKVKARCGVEFNRKYGVLYIITVWVRLGVKWRMVGGFDDGWTKMEYMEGLRWRESRALEWLSEEEVKELKVDVWKKLRP